MVALFTLWELYLIVLFCKYKMWLDHRISRAGRKIKFYIILWRNESRYSWFLINPNMKGHKAILRITHKICSRKWVFEFLNLNLYGSMLWSDWWRNSTYGMTLASVCVEFHILSARVIDNQLYFCNFENYLLKFK